MRGFAIAVSVALCASALSAQKVDTWSKTYGGTGVESIGSLDLTDSGDLLVFSDQSGPAITRLTPAGEVLWNRLIGGFEHVHKPKIHVMKNGSAVVAGTVIEPDPFGFSGFVVHLDGSGTVTWAKRYALATGLLLEDVHPTSDGGYLVAGHSQKLESAIIKLSSIGEVQWAKSYDVSGTDYFGQILPLREGFLLVGTMRNSLWLVSISATGVLRWHKSYDTYSRGLNAVSSDGGAIVVGHTNNDGLVVRINREGAEEWQLTFPHDGEEKFQSVTETSDRNFLIGGTTRSFGAGDGDVWLIELDRAGKVLWQRIFGGSAAEGTGSDDSALVSVAAAKGGGAFVASNTQSFGAGHTDLWLMKIDAGGNGSECAPGTVANIQPKKTDLPVSSIAIETRPLEVSAKEVTSLMTPKALNSAEACIPLAARAAAEASLKSKPGSMPAALRTAPPVRTSETPVIVAQPSVPSRADALPQATGPVHVVANERGPFNEMLSSLMNSSDFKALEDIAAGLIRTKARFPSGNWKITDFYDAIASDESFNVTPERYLELLDSWAQAFPQSPTPLIAKAKYHDHLGWRARGTDFSNTVTQSGWGEFHRQGKHSIEALKRAEQLKPRDPEYYATLVDVLGAHGSDTDQEAAFRRGVSVEPTYYPLYFRRARYLRPQWGGDPGDVEKLAARGADQTRAAIGEELYALVAWWYHPPEEAFTEHRFAWPRVRQGFFDILKRFPGGSYRAHAFARMSVVAGDRVTARAVFALPATEWNQDGESVWGRRERYDAAKKWATEEPGASAPARSAPAPQQRWVDDLAKNWPPLVMPVVVSTQDGRKVSGAGFLVRVNGSIFGVTSAGLLSSPGKVVYAEEARLQLSDLLMQTGGRPLKIGRMVSVAKPRYQGLAFTLAQQPAKSPVQLLQARSTPIDNLNSRFYAVQCYRVVSGKCEQRVHALTMSLGSGAKSFGDFFFNVTGGDALAPEQLVGSPVIDGEGLVVGVVVEKASNSGAIPPMVKVEQVGHVFGWDVQP